MREAAFSPDSRLSQVMHPQKEACWETLEGSIYRGKVSMEACSTQACLASAEGSVKSRGFKWQMRAAVVLPSM